MCSNDLRQVILVLVRPNKIETTYCCLISFIFIIFSSKLAIFGPFYGHYKGPVGICTSEEKIGPKSFFYSIRFFDEKWFKMDQIDLLQRFIKKFVWEVTFFGGRFLNFYSKLA